MRTSRTIRKPGYFESLILDISLVKGWDELCKTQFGSPSCCCSNAMSTTPTPSLLTTRYLLPQRLKYFMLSQVPLLSTGFERLLIYERPPMLMRWIYTMELVKSSTSIANLRLDDGSVDRILSFAS